MGSPCLVTGSRIRTANGDIAVEDIYAGDEIVTLRDGIETIEPVVWVGHRKLDIGAHAYPEVSVPVRIRAGAVAEGQPVRDLFLSQDHCLFLDGKCVPSRLLVNGGSITFERNTREVTYHHVELARHGIMLAEGLPTESYLDTGNRNQFSNADVPTALHPTFAVNADASAWLTDACAPLAVAAEEVEPIWTSLAQRSDALGFSRPVTSATQDADLRIVADGAVIRPTQSAPRDGERTSRFVLPGGTQSVTLTSRICIPVDIGAPWLGDARRLGVRINGISIQSDAGTTAIAIDDPELTRGWYDTESQGAAIWRWTDGAAQLPLCDTKGAAVVTIRWTPAAGYPEYDEMLRLVA